MFTEKTCAICHDITMKSYKSCCGQYYHINCLYDWIKVNNCCPICKVRYSSYIMEVMHTWSRSNLDDKDKIRFQLMFCDENEFCSVCYKKVDGNSAVCDGYKYHLKCIKDHKNCPECDVELPNNTIYEICNAIHKNNIFDPINYLDHTRRTILKAKRGGGYSGSGISLSEQMRRKNIIKKRRGRHYASTDYYSTDEDMPDLVVTPPRAHMILPPPLPPRRLPTFNAFLENANLPPLNIPDDLPPTQGIIGHLRRQIIGPRTQSDTTESDDSYAGSRLVNYDSDTSISSMD